MRRRKLVGANAPAQEVRDEDIAVTEQVQVQEVSIEEVEIENSKSEVDHGALEVSEKTIEEVELSAESKVEEDAEFKEVKAPKPKLNIGSKTVRKQVKKLPVQGGRLNRNDLMKLFQQHMESNSVELNLRESEDLFKTFEDFFQGILSNYSCKIAGIMFRHKSKSPIFREPKGFLSYIRPHVEVEGKFAIGKEVVPCRVTEDGEFEAGSKDKQGEFTPDANITAELKPMYERHLGKAKERLEKEEAKLAARKEKLA